MWHTLIWERSDSVRKHPSGNLRGAVRVDQRGRSSEVMDTIVDRLALPHEEARLRVEGRLVARAYVGAASGALAARPPVAHEAAVRGRTCTRAHRPVGPARWNMLGPRRFGMSVPVASLGAPAWVLRHGWAEAGVIAPVPSETSLRTACPILAWLVGVDSATVRIAADRYAPYLLEAALDLET